MISPKLPVTCPSCSNTLKVTQLSCPECSTAVSGGFDLPILARLNEDEQNFILRFFLSSGSLKQMAIEMGNSYPTVRNKLDDLIEKVKALQQLHTTKP
jgi:hypothetical protein